MNSTIEAVNAAEIVANRASTKVLATFPISGEFPTERIEAIAGEANIFVIRAINVEGRTTGGPRVVIWAAEEFDDARDAVQAALESAGWAS